MSVIYLHCCDNYLDLDYRCDEVIYYRPENEYYCYEHLLDKLQNEFNITEEHADKMIDEMV